MNQIAGVLSSSYWSQMELQASQTVQNKVGMEMQFFIQLQCKRAKTIRNMQSLPIKEVMIVSWTQCIQYYSYSRLYEKH